MPSKVRSDIMKDSQHKYYLANKEKLKEKAKQYYIKNKEKCIIESSRRQKENPIKMEEYRQRWFTKRPLYSLLHNCKRRAKENNIPYDLDLDYIESLLQPTHCPVLGIPIDGLTRETSMSLDKVVPQLGYTKGNVCFISMKANRMKQESTLEELKLIVAYLERT
jgi:hypothetical protein